MVTPQQLMLAQVFESEALLTVWDRKGLRCRPEVLDEAKRLRKPETR